VGIHKSGRNPYGKKLGFKTLITPSKKSLKTHNETIHQVIKKNKSATQESLIFLLNPVIKGWANYYSHVCSKETFSDSDKQVWFATWAWAKRRHSNKSKQWVAEKYWSTIG